MNVLRRQEGLTWIKRGHREIAKTPDGYTLLVVRVDGGYLAGCESPTGATSHTTAETWREARWIAKALSEMDANPITSDVIMATNNASKQKPMMQVTAFAILVAVAILFSASIAATLAEIVRGSM